MCRIPALIPLFTGLCVLACLSPILTFASLFQLKEWRMDRLREHLRREGLVSQLTSMPRLGLAAAGFLMAMEFPERGAGITGVTLVGLVLITAMQLTLGRQPAPTWTRKALMIVLLSLVVAALAALILAWLWMPLLIVLALLAPLATIAAWALLLPLDRRLKDNVFAAARAARDRHPDLVVIGVAGSVGKTTTKELLKCVLADLSPLVTPAHVNTEMGVAQWLTKELTASSEQRAEHMQPTAGRWPLTAIVEMGAYARGEIALTCSFARPTIGVMTALGSDHLALFGSEAAIVEANAELLQALPKNGKAFIYGDNSAAREAAKHVTCPATLVGTEKECALRAENIVETENGLSFVADGQAYSVPLRGKHNVGNILLAIGVAKSLGVTPARVAELLANFTPLPGTFQLKQENGITILDDTYNISPLSFAAGLAWAKTRTERPRVLLTSGLLEVGDEEARFLNELGAAAAQSVDRVVFTTNRGTAAFAEGFGKPVELLSNTTQPVPAGSLILCAGRMSQATIRRLLPA